MLALTKCNNRNNNEILWYNIIGEAGRQYISLPLEKRKILIINSQTLLSNYQLCLGQYCCQRYTGGKI